MTPDVFTNLYIVNCTTTDIVGTNINNYQMVSWYAPGAQMPNQSISGPQFIQFKAGGGDTDDAGQIYLNLNSTTQSTQFLLYGGSNPDSSHYIDCRSFVVPAQPTMNLIFGLVANGMWPMTVGGASSISWYPFQYLNLGALAPNGTDPYGPNARKVLAIVDLNQLYSSSDASEISKNIASLTPTQQEDLWLQVSAFAQVGSTALTYSLTELVFQNTDPTQTSQQVGLNTQVTLDTAATSRNEYRIINNYENNFTLTTDAAFSFGAEIEVDSPIPFIPGASLNTSFEVGSTQATASTSGQSLEFTEEIGLTGPGVFEITGFMNIDDDFSSPFTGTLIVTGTFSGLPINGQVLAALAGAQGGWNISASQQVTINATSASIQVAGTLTGNFAFEGVFNQTKIS